MFLPERNGALSPPPPPLMGLINGIGEYVGVDAEKDGVLYGVVVPENDTENKEGAESLFLSEPERPFADSLDNNLDLSEEQESST